MSPQPLTHHFCTASSMRLLLLTAGRIALYRPLKRYTTLHGSLLRSIPFCVCTRALVYTVSNSMQILPALKSILYTYNIQQRIFPLHNIYTQSLCYILATTVAFFLISLAITYCNSTYAQVLLLMFFTFSLPLVPNSTCRQLNPNYRSDNTSSFTLLNSLSTFLDFYPKVNYLIFHLPQRFNFPSLNILRLKVYSIKAFSIAPTLAPLAYLHL